MTEKIKFGTDGWRAIIADGFTFANVRKVSRAIADHILQEGREEQGVLVAYDNRFMAGDFARQVAGVLAAAGVRILFCQGPLATPAPTWGLPWTAMPTGWGWWMTGGIITAPTRSSPSSFIT